MNFFRQLRQQNLASALVTILLGLVLLFSPQSLIRMVLTLIGWVVLISGVVSVVSFVTNRGTVYASAGGLIFGVIRVIFGLWMVRNPWRLVELLATVIAILILIHALSDLQYAYSAYQAGAANWISAAISGGLSLVLALVVLVNPFGSAMTVAALAGICLVVDGVTDLLMIHRMGDFF